MRHFLQTIIFLLLANVSVKAQVFCTNQTEKGVWIAVAYNYLQDATWEWKRDTWRSEGWLYVLPKDTVQLTTHLGIDKEKGVITNVFYYAYQPDGRKWEGNRKFLADVYPPNVSPDKYSYLIDDANHVRDEQTNPNIQVLLFKAGTNAYQKGTFLITLRQTDVNDPPVHHGPEFPSEFDNRSKELQVKDPYSRDYEEWTPDAVK